MTNEVNSQGDHLSSDGPSWWVVRHTGRMLFAAPKATQAVKWLNRYVEAVNYKWTMKDAIKAGIVITRSYTAEARYVGFDPEWSVEFTAFDDAADGLRAWVHRMWEQDRDNHPSLAGVSKAYGRWHDVSALLHVVSLTMIPNPSFTYDFGQLSPPEGKGNRLVVRIFPTPAEVLAEKVSHHV